MPKTWNCPSVFGNVVMLSAGTRMARDVLPYSTSIPSPMCGSIFVSRPVLKCCRTLHARLCWAVWGLTVQLTQTCDITVKDEYIYLRRVHRERERVIYWDLILLKSWTNSDCFVKNANIKTHPILLLLSINLLTTPQTPEMFAFLYGLCSK